MVALIEDGRPSGGTLLRLGNVTKKLLHLYSDRLTELGVPLTEHDKLSDVVLYREERDWLFLFKAVTSHGPLGLKRMEELEITLKDCAATRVSGGAFPDFQKFKRHGDRIKWTIEFWVAEIPDHLIQFKRDRFLGTKESTPWMI